MIINMTNDKVETGLTTNDKTLGELFGNEEVEVIEWISQISYLVEKVDYLTQLLEDKKEVIENIDSLDGCVYKAKVLDKHSISMVKVGEIDDVGVIKLYNIETYAPIVPCLYQPEFYYIGKDNPESSKSKYRGSNLPNPVYKKFTPKNINQIVIVKDDSEYTTGYINENGVAIYYDQLPKDSNEEKIHKLHKPELQELVS